MTLSTHILLTGVDHEKAFNKVNELLDIPSTRVTTDKVEDGVRRIDNQVGQGFDAWVLSKSQVGGVPFVGEHDIGEWACEDDCTYWTHVVSGYTVDINLDTAYGYSQPGVGGCADLHARIIVGLLQWLTKQDAEARLQWINEFTGEVHTGLDGIQEFIGNGGEAQHWFSHVALPAIASRMENDDD